MNFIYYRGVNMAYKKEKSKRKLSKLIRWNYHCLDWLILIDVKNPKINFDINLNFKNSDIFIKNTYQKPSNNERKYSLNAKIE